MASSSKYIQLSSSILLEYIYSDQSAINEIGNPYRLSTSTTPIWITKNEYTNQPQLLNADSAKLVENGIVTNTGNVRDRSFAIIGSHKCALLDTNRTLFYNDYDPKLTPSSELLVNFTSPQSPVYDRIKLHLVQGFDFEGYQGLVLSTKFKDKADKDIVLSNFVYLKSDSWETYNPSPFFFGGKIYNAYVEFKILSLHNLIEDYWIKNATNGLVADRITGGVGIKRNQFIQIYFSFVNNKYTLNGQDYIDLIDAKSLDLKVRDQFEQVSAYIKESDVNDYIEYYATYGGEIIENYIYSLNNSNGSYILLHDLVVSEYVYDASTGNSSWIKTDTLQTTQDTNFGTPNYYRPIVRNNGAISFKIDYTIRLYNRNDNSQVWKNSSMISYSVDKFGRKLKTINLNGSLIQAKIYNQSVVKEITVNKLPEKFISNTKYITSIASFVNVSTSAETSTNEITKSNSNSNGQAQIFGNGLGRIHVPDSSTFLKFSFFQNSDGQNKFIDLSAMEDFVITFIDGSNQDFDIPEYPSTYILKSKGEVLFNLTQADSKKILSLSDRSFTIYQINEIGTKTFLYTGTFYSTSEYKILQETNRIALLETEIANNADLIQTINQDLVIKTAQLQRLNTENLRLTTLNSDLSLMSKGSTATIQELQKTNAALIKKLNDLNSDTTTSLLTKVNEVNSTTANTLSSLGIQSTRGRSNNNNDNYYSPISTSTDINIANGALWEQRLKSMSGASIKDVAAVSLSGSAGKSGLSDATS